MNWRQTKHKTQTAMNQSRLAEIEYRVREKLLLLESVAQDFREIEDLGLMSTTQFENYISKWGFTRATMKSVLDAQSVRQDVHDIIDPVLMFDPGIVLEFVPLNELERRELAVAVMKTGELKPELVSKTKSSLFPFKLRLNRIHTFVNRLKSKRRVNSSRNLNGDLIFCVVSNQKSHSHPHLINF